MFHYIKATTTQIQVTTMTEKSPHSYTFCGTPPTYAKILKIQKSAVQYIIIKKGISRTIWHVISTRTGIITLLKVLC